MSNENKCTYVKEYTKSMMLNVIQSFTVSSKSILVHPKCAILFSAKQCFNFYPYNDNKLIYCASFSYRFFKCYLLISLVHFPYVFVPFFVSVLCYISIYFSYRSFNYCNIYTCCSLRW